MRVAGTLARDGGGARRRQAGVAGLADLHRTVVDELSHDQADSGADDGQADRPLGGQDGAEAGRRPPHPGACAEQAPFQNRETAKQKHGSWTQASEQSPRNCACFADGASQRRPGTLQLPIDRAIELPARRE